MVRVSFSVRLGSGLGLVLDLSELFTENNEDEHLSLPSLLSLKETTLSFLNNLFLKLFIFEYSL